MAKVPFFNIDLDNIKNFMDAVASRPKALVGTGFHVAEQALKNLYFHADKMRSPAELREMYDFEQPNFTRVEWLLEVANGDTILGYWDWASHKLTEE